MSKFSLFVPSSRDILPASFAAAITLKHVDDKFANIRDWRVAYYTGKLRFEPLKLPRDIANKCVAHVKALGLEFGAIDLVVDKKGKYWFLENNPNGQWEFIGGQTAELIAKAIARLLERGVAGEGAFAR